MTGWQEGDWRDESLCKFEESNLRNHMGLEFYDLSHPWGLGQPCWPYFEDVKIERLHGMSKSGVLTQKITTVMHSLELTSMFPRKCSSGNPLHG